MSWNRSFHFNSLEIYSKNPQLTAQLTLIGTVNFVVILKENMSQIFWSFKKLSNQAARNTTLRNAFKKYKKEEKQENNILISRWYVHGSYLC